MPIRQITDAAGLDPWLPSDYSGTGWDAAQIDAALNEGADPRLIAAEIWEDYAASLPEETGEATGVRKWTNLDTSVEYAASTSPRDFALRQAKHHRARAKVRSVSLAHRRIESEAAEGLLNEAPADEKTTTSGPRGQE